MSEPDLPAIETIFPKLAASAYIRTSDPDPSYNCLAWAVGETGAWWQAERVKGFYWPIGIDRENSVFSWIAIMRLHGFELCDSATPEVGWERVAIYVERSGEPAHISREIQSGGWTSKLGKLEDIWHETLEGVECEDYGTASVFLRRARPDWNADDGLTVDVR